METLLLVLVVAIITVVVVAMIRNSKKKKPTPSPSPIPTQQPPAYRSFLQNVETVIRNNLTQEDLDTFFNGEGIKSQYEQYQFVSGFMADFNALLAKYNVDFPY